jgi:asparagine N-glycosylation enzyme membrane subunit Stt3
LAKHNQGQAKCFKVAMLKRDVEQGRVGRGLFRTWSVWIWFVGAAAWFLVAALSLHHHALGSGVLATAISALFLAAGMFFRKLARRGDKL